MKVTEKKGKTILPMSSRARRRRAFLFYAAAVAIVG